MEIEWIYAFVAVETWNYAKDITSIANGSATDLPSLKRRRISCAQAEFPSTSYQACKTEVQEPEVVGRGSDSRRANIPYQVAALLSQKKHHVPIYFEYTVTWERSRVPDNDCTLQEMI